MMALPLQLRSIDQLTQQDIAHIIECTLGNIDRTTWRIHRDNRHQGRTVMNLFYEPSTRTHTSFHLAAHYLGAHSVSWQPQTSSEQKGEVLSDTLRNMAAMWVDLFVVRHPDPHIWDHLPEDAAHGLRIINAGNGDDEHPTQALLDTATIIGERGDLAALKIVIVGDSRHARVAHSQIKCFQKMGVTNLVLAGPPELLPETIPGVQQESDLSVALQHADVIIALRLQKERMPAETVSDKLALATAYQINADHLASANPNALLMHPGPVNEGIELAPGLASHAQSVILKQVGYGVATRMALLSMVLEQNGT